MHVRIVCVCMSAFACIYVYTIQLYMQVYMCDFVYK